MRFPYRLAAIDLDETLLGPDHRIAARNAAAIHALAARGVECVIASGRMHEATTRYAEELGLAGPIISYNGAMVRPPTDTIAWRHVRMAPGPAAEIARMCADRGLHLNYYLDDRLLIARRTQWGDLYLRRTGSPVEVVGDLTALEGSRPTKLLIVDSPEATDALMAECRSRYGPALYITKTNAEYLEFMDPTVSKATALAFVARRFGIARAECMAFGDGANDAPMIAWAGLGIAMAGGSAQALAAADRLAPAYEEDGLGRAIEELLAVHMANPPA